MRLRHHGVPNAAERQRRISVRQTPNSLPKRYSRRSSKIRILSAATAICFRSRDWAVAWMNTGAVSMPIISTSEAGGSQKSAFLRRSMELEGNMELDIG